MVTYSSNIIERFLSTHPTSTSQKEPRSGMSMWGGSADLYRIPQVARTRSGSDGARLIIIEASPRFAAPAISRSHPPLRGGSLRSPQIFGLRWKTKFPSPVEIKPSNEGAKPPLKLTANHAVRKEKHL